MALTCQQIITLATQTAKCAGFVSQAQQLFNAILGELCEGYDLSVTRATFSFNFNTALGSGPIPLATDWLRAEKDDVFYVISGVRYVMVPISLAEFDAQVQQAGLNAYPGIYAVDNSPLATGVAPNMYVWPPPSGSYPVTARYHRKVPDYSVVQLTDGVTTPWFPNTLYLLRRLTGEMMLLSNDDRAPQFLGGEYKTQEGTVFLGAAALLDRYLKMEGDEQTTPRVTLDKRFFGSNFNRLPNTKTVGWVILLCALLAGGMFASTGGSHGHRDEAATAQRVYAGLETKKQSGGQRDQQAVEGSEPATGAGPSA